METARTIAEAIIAAVVGILGALKGFRWTMSKIRRADADTKTIEIAAETSLSQVIDLRVKGLLKEDEERISKLERRETELTKDVQLAVAERVQCRGEVAELKGLRRVDQQIIRDLRSRVERLELERNRND